MSDIQDQPIDEVGSHLTRIMDSALRERGLHPEQKAAAAAVAPPDPATAKADDAKPANEPISEIGYKTAAVMEEAMKPLTAEELKIGQFDDFGKALPPYDEWDAELEADARQWMASGEFNEGQARTLQLAFSEYAQNDFSQEHVDRNFDASHSYLSHRYGDQKDAAIAACNKVISEIGGEKLSKWLGSTGMGCSPAVVFEISRLAERKGYITRKGA